MIWMPAEPSTTVQAVLDDESNFINMRLLEDFLDFLRGKVPGRLEIQADSEKNHR